jgi:hypothetical protein
MATRLKEGGTVWVQCDVKNGIHPTERYFTFKLPDQELPVTGFVPSQEVCRNRVRAAVIRVVGSTVLLVFPGELISATNPVRVPKTWLSEQAANAA